MLDVTLLWPPAAITSLRLVSIGNSMNFVSIWSVKIGFNAMTISPLASRTELSPLSNLSFSSAVGQA